MQAADFIDDIDIVVRSGKGGRGSVHFRHEKFVPFGGPDGGDGGKGGDVVFVCKKDLSTLYHLRKSSRRFFASDGDDGCGEKMKGKNGESVFIPVPVGTCIMDKSTSEIIYEMLTPGEEFVILKGGRGGLGNVHFKSSINQAPRYAQPGEEGVEMNLHLELRLLADIGLVGFPNVGKSSFLSVVSSAKPTVADYEFTTLIPQLGIVNHKSRSFVVADLPGIINGAHLGKGLGIRFLKHLHHVKCLCYMLSAESDPYKAFLHLKEEISLFDRGLLNKASVVFVNKSDLINREDEEMIRDDFRREGIAPHFISSLTRDGIDEALDFLLEVVECN